MTIINSSHLQQLAYENPGSEIEFGNGYAFLTIGRRHFCALLSGGAA